MLAAIQDIAATLPTEDEKKDAIRALIDIESYFREVRNWLELLPTSVTSSDLQNALARFDELLDKAEQNVLVARSLGVSTPTKRPIAPRAPASNAERAGEILKTLDPLSIDQIRERLLEPNYTLRDLRGVADVLGLRYQTKVNRETLAHQLVTRIANERGYRHLRGEDSTIDSSDLPGDNDKDGAPSSRDPLINAEPQ